MKKTFILLALLAIASGVNAQLLYKISGNGLKQPSYLFGTHHLAPKSMLDEVTGLRKAMAEADRAVGEIDMTHNQNEMAAQMQGYMLAPADSTLSKVISPEEFQRIDPVFQKYAPMPGMTLAMLEPMKPAAVSTMVAVMMVLPNVPDYNPEEQLDKLIQVEMQKAGKSIGALETIDRQCEVLFNATPIRIQAKALVDLLSDPDKAVTESKKMTESYMAGDLAAMAQIESETEDPEEKAWLDHLLYERNADWLNKLPAMLKENSNLIAVGAMHLVGDNGLIEGLRALGYTVEPVGAAD